MSGELLSLIGQATGRRVRWNDVVVMNNVAAIPPIKDKPGDYVWNRGFNVVVLDTVGTPKFFCKCRSLYDERLAHETNSMLALRRAPSLTDYVPPVQQAKSETIRVLVTDFIDGIPVNDLLERRFDRHCADIVQQALSGVVELTRLSTDVLPELMPASRDLNLADEARDTIEYLGNVGLSSADAATLSTALSQTANLPRQLQHGDLWPANLVRAKRKLWFLDFEMFGRIQVPMYDVFHFLRTCADVWAPDNETTWLDQMRYDDALNLFIRNEMHRASNRLHVTPEQSVSALIFYVLHFAATTHRRNPDGHVWRRFWQEACTLAEHVRCGNLGRLLVDSRERR